MTAGRPVSDLLNDDGSVDTSAVKAQQNRGTPARTHVTPAECEQIRRELRDRRHAVETATALALGTTTVRNHARGVCHHAESAIDEPTLTHRGGLGWVVDDE